MEKLVISCMDRRLNMHLDRRYNDGKTFFMRNAGANVGTLADSIRDVLRKHEISSVHIATHTDCGAMGVVFQALKEGKRFETSIHESLIKQFEGMGFRDRKELESSNGKLQVEAVRLVAGSIAVHLEPIDVKTLGIPSEHGKHTLILTKALSVPYNDMVKSINTGIFDSYVIQGNVATMISDIRIAVTLLEIKDIRLEAFSSAEEKDMNAEMARLRREAFMRDATLSFVRAKQISRHHISPQDS